MRNFLKKLTSIKFGYSLFIFSYVLLVLIFAMIYYFLYPKGFYHSYSKFETISVKNYISQKIEKKLSDYMITLSNSNNLPEPFILFKSQDVISRLFIFQQSFRVENIKTDEVKIEFDLTYEFLAHTGFIEKPYSGSRSRNTSHIIASSRDYLSKNMVNFSIAPYSFSFTETIGVLFSKFNEQYSSIEVANGQQPHVIYLEAESDLESKIESLRALESGFPSSDFSHFIRLLYFSVVTITTLGYGDIVPIETYTRILVGVESFLGAFLISLFFYRLPEFQKQRSEKKVQDE